MRCLEAVLVVAATLVVEVSGRPGIILEYTAGTHARREYGTPGEDVRGEYSLPWPPSSSRRLSPLGAGNVIVYRAGVNGIIVTRSVLPGAYNLPFFFWDPHYFDPRIYDVTNFDGVEPEDDVMPGDDVEPEANVTPVDDVEPEANVTPVDDVEPEANVTPVDDVEAEDDAMPGDDAMYDDVMPGDDAMYDDVMPVDDTVFGDVMPVHGVKPENDVITGGDIKPVKKNEEDADAPVDVALGASEDEGVEGNEETPVGEAPVEASVSVAIEESVDSSVETSTEIPVEDSVVVVDEPEESSVETLTEAPVVTTDGGPVDPAEKEEEEILTVVVEEEEEEKEGEKVLTNGTSTTEPEDGGFFFHTTAEDVDTPLPAGVTEEDEEINEIQFPKDTPPEEELNEEGVPSDQTPPDEDTTNTESPAVGEFITEMPRQYLDYSDDEDTQERNDGEEVVTVMPGGERDDDEEPITEIPPVVVEAVVQEMTYTKVSLEDSVVPEAPEESLASTKASKAPVNEAVITETTVVSLVTEAAAEATVATETAVEATGVTEAAVEETVVTEAAVEATGVTEAAVEATRVTEAAVEETVVTEAAVEATEVTEAAVEATVVTEAAVEATVVTEAAVEATSPADDSASPQTTRDDPSNTKTTPQHSTNLTTPEEALTTDVPPARALVVVVRETEVPYNKTVPIQFPIDVTEETDGPLKNLSEESLLPVMMADHDRVGEMKSPEEESPAEENVLMGTSEGDDSTIELKKEQRPILNPFLPSLSFPPRRTPSLPISPPWGTPLPPFSPPTGGLPLPFAPPRRVLPHFISSTGVLPRPSSTRVPPYPSPYRPYIRYYPGLPPHKFQSKLPRGYTIPLST